MSIIHIAAKDLRLLLRDRKALLTLLGTPLILTFVLGTALANMWSAQTPPSVVLWINEDSGTLGNILINDVFTLPGIAEWVRLEAVTDREEALRRVQKGNATVLVTVPASFSTDVASGSASLKVYRDPGSSIRADAITQITQRFAMELSARRAVFGALGQQGIAPDPQAIEQALAAVALQVQPETAAGEVGTGPRAYVAMDYYAASMGVMYLLFAVSRGATTFLLERESGTLARMYQSPVKPWAILGGKFVGIFLVALAQISGVVVFSTLVFRVNWGNFAASTLLILAAVTASSGLGVLIAAVSKTASAADALGTMIVLPMTVLGGGMQPLFALPAVVRFLANFTINGWALEGFTRIMFEHATVGDVLLNCLVLSAAGAVMLLLGGLTLRRKGVAR
jgi:ABC-2 type transport system permease protein